jgi:glutathione S-transferase
MLTGLTMLSSSTSASAIARPASLKVYYGDMPFWRAEVVRLALFMGDVPFEDVRDQKRVDLIAAGKLTFGAVPVLEADGKMLSQTSAMAVYAAKLAGMHPEDAWDAAKVDECISGCTDVTGTVGKTFGMKDDEKASARAALIAADGRLTLHLGGLEKICSENGGCSYAVGSTITVADIAIWRLVGWLSSGVIDGIPGDYVSTTFPHLAELVTAVDAHPKVGEWKTLHAKFSAPK